MNAEVRSLDAMVKNKKTINRLTKHTREKKTLPSVGTYISSIYLPTIPIREKYLLAQENKKHINTVHTQVDFSLKLLKKDSYCFRVWSALIIILI